MQGPRNVRRVYLLAAVLVLLSGPACHRFFQHEEKEDDPGSRGRQIRVLDPDGATLGSYRTRTRSAVAYDSIGIPIARARALPSHVEVLDRTATVVLTITPSDEVEAKAEAETEAGHFAELTGRDGQPLGFLQVWPGQRVVRSSVRRAALEETIVHIRDESEVAEVYGAEGTDLVLRVYPVAPHRLEIADVSGDVIAEFMGARLETWIAAALGMEGPLTGDEGQAYFRVGLLAYLRTL